MSSANRAIDNYINGNLTEAKRIAIRVAESALFATLQDDYGKTCDQAQAIARYLKGKVTFQQACDIEHVQKSTIDANTEGFTDSERMEWVRTHNTITGKPL